MNIEKIKNISEEDLPELLGEIGQVKGTPPKALKQQFKQEKKYSLIRKIPIIAIVAILFCVAIVAAPIISQKFFYVPGEGLVEQNDEESIYLLLSDNSNIPEHEIKYGYWYNGTVYLYFSTKFAPQFDKGASLGYNAEEYKVSTERGGSYLNTMIGYRIYDYTMTIEGVDVSDAMNGFELSLDSITGNLRFDRNPAEYKTYHVTHNNVTLTLIPMSEEYTEFIITAAFTDGRKGEIIISDTSFEMVYQKLMSVRDSEGNKYPVGKYGDIFVVEEKPEHDIIRFELNELALNYYIFGQGTTVTIPVPESGKVIDIDIDFILDDGLTKGKITQIGRDVRTEYSGRKLKFTKNDDYLFPKGSLTVITSSLDDNHIWYGFASPIYGSKYDKFISQYIEKPTFYGHQPIEKILEHLDDAKSQGILIPSYVLNYSKNGSFLTMNYIPDGSDTVEIVYYGCNITITDDWSINFK